MREKEICAKNKNLSKNFIANGLMGTMVTKEKEVARYLYTSYNLIT
jgi:hypothetical protein